MPKPGVGIDIPDMSAEIQVRKDSLEQQNVAVAKLGRALQSLKLLKSVGGALPMTKENDAWQQLIITVDSGASESVAPPAAASNVPIEDSPGSRGGVTYEVANGEMISNLGQKNCIVHA